MSANALGTQTDIGASTTTPDAFGTTETTSADMRGSHHPPWEAMMSKPVSYAISMFINGICLNPKEFVLDGPDGDVMLFEKPADALEYLRSVWKDMPKDASDIDEYGIFIEPYGEENDDE